MLINYKACGLENFGINEIYRTLDSAVVCFYFACCIFPSQSATDGLDVVFSVFQIGPEIEPFWPDWSTMTGFAINMRLPSTRPELRQDDTGTKKFLKLRPLSVF